MTKIFFFFYILKKKNIFKKKYFFLNNYLKKDKFLKKTKILKKNSFFLSFFFNLVIKGPFKAHFLVNFIKFHNLSFFDKLLRLACFYNFKVPFFSYFLIIYFFFLIYRQPNLLFFFFYDFFKNYSYKNHNYFKRSLTFLLKNTSILDLQLFKIKGFLLKFKGKITGKAGDRRKVFFFKIGGYSITSIGNDYDICYKQLNSNTGSVGCTILINRV